ncbi:MAG: AzlD domain-containing protein [Synergistaceae bacterium]|jgi:branched-subunit amino acid transport protein|nr:AzlD domain-containing protein [Synergistaceae bacterium]
MDKSLWIVVGGMTAVTLLPRVLPILLLSGRKLPYLVERWLSLIAPAILSALLFPELLFVNDADSAFFSSKTFLLASLPAFFTAWRTKSLFKTVVAGIAAAAFLRYVLSP